MIAYKGTTNFEFEGMTFNIGQTYTLTTELDRWNKQYIFCRKIIYANEYTPFLNKDTKVLEIEVLGDVIDDCCLSATNKFKVLREVPKEEWKCCKFDKNNNLIYLEEKFETEGTKYKYDKNNNMILYENGEFWEKRKYDKNNNLISCKYSTGYWEKYKYDQNNNLIYWEKPSGIIFKAETK